MSSPFAVFRKHQKVLLAASMIVAMVAFVFGDYLSGRRGAADQRHDDVVIDWKFDGHGPLKQSELQGTVQLLSQFNAFVQRLMQQLRGISPPQQRITERVAVNRLMLARLAEQQGMTISDAAIRSVLRNSFTAADGQPVTTAQLQQALASANMSEHQLFAAMRMVLLASKMEALFTHGLGVDTPIQRYEHYNRLERKVKAELVEVKAADYVSKVADPDAATVQKFFDAHKDKYPTVPYDNFLRSMSAGQKWPDTYAAAGEAGFKEEYKAQFQYIKLPRETFIDLAAAAVTDKEIADYYEKEKDAKFKTLELPKDEKKEDAAKAAAAKPEGDKKPDDAAKPVADAAKEPAKPTYEPLDKVKDTIRKTLAQDKATQLMDEALAKIKQTMDAYSTVRSEWTIKLQDDPKAAEPEPPALTELATAEKGSEARTDLATAFDLDQKYDLGKSFTLQQIPTAIPGFMQTRRQSIIQTFYDNPTSIEDYVARESQDEDGNRYIFWRTKQQDARVPELAQVRDTVVQAWKLGEARKLALAEANQLADKVRAAGDKPFKEVFPDRKVIETGEFSWLTPNAVSPEAPPTISKIEGVPEPGDEFMRVVTDLNVGQVGVATDYSKNDDYVARVTATAYTPDAYNSLFLTNVRDYQKYAHGGTDQWRNVITSWEKELKAQIGYKEQRPLDQGRTQEPIEDDGDAE